MAGEAADAEGRIAQVCRRLAAQDPVQAQAYLVSADEADRFASHKREEERRWRLT